jgi:hypothetical protein
MMSGRGMGRGRGGFNSMQGPPRQQFDTRQPSNTTTVTPVKRGGMQNGPPGSKRGRYDQGPPSRQGMPPKPHYMNPQAGQIPPHSNSYNNMPTHGNSYPDANQQFMDQYSHNGGYNAPMPPPHQNNYMPSSGYQNSYGSGPTSQMGYSQSTEYDHSASGGGYQDYNSQAYPAHDTRYQNYSQDYRQSGYGPTADYGSVPQDSYPTGQYDDRSYGNYESYSQGYANHAGYY